MAKSPKKITKQTKIWGSDLDIVLPINGPDIANFDKWVNWRGYTQNHRGFDFAAYLTKDKRCVLGLPSETPIRAVADGVVKQISQGLAEYYQYATFINIAHGKEDSGMFSCYHHVEPLVEPNQPVKKGDIIAILYKDPGNYKGKLVHLHFELTNGWDIKNRYVDPISIFPILAGYNAEPQYKQKFKISGIKKQPRISIANFRNLRIE